MNGSVIRRSGKGIMPNTQELLASIIFCLEKDSHIEELSDDVQKYIIESTRHLRSLDGHMLLCPFCGGHPLIEKVMRSGYENCPDDPDAYAYGAVSMKRYLRVKLENSY